MKSCIPLPPELHQKMRGFADRLGTARAASLFGLSRPCFCQAAGGMAVHAATRALVVARLAELEAPAPKENSHAAQ